MDVYYETNYPTPASQGKRTIILHNSDQTTIEGLYRTLSPSLGCNPRMIQLAQERTYFVTARDRDRSGALVGIASLHEMYGLNAFHGRIEKLAVQHELRRQGIAKYMILHLLEMADWAKMSYVDITKNPNRVDISGLLEKLGFELVRATEVYRKELMLVSEGVEP